MATSPNERIQALDVLRGFALCGIVFINIYSPLVNLVAGVVLLGAGIMFVGGAGLIPGLFLIGSALASYRVPEELPGRPGLLAALCGGFAAASLLLWWLSPVIPGGPEIAALEVVQPVLMSCAYMTGLLLLLHTPLRAPLTAALVPLGRTALTNYLLATVVFVAVGRAIGLEGSARWGATIALGAGILAAQAVLSPLWLRRFRYGPMEWLWRCVTWWRWMPIRAPEVRATT